MRDPKVSVLIPTYNRAHTIGRAIRSIPWDLAGGIEIVVVDDASTDDTVTAIEGLQAEGAPIVLLRHEKNLGVGYGRATALQAAKADVIAWLDSDDEWVPGSLEWRLAALNGQRSDQRVLVSGLLENRLEPGCQWPDWIPQEQRDQQTRLTTLPCTVADRRLFEDIPIDPTMRVGGDLDWLFRARRQSVRFELIERPALIRWVGTDNLGHRGTDNRSAVFAALRRHTAKRRGGQVHADPDSA